MKTVEFLEDYKCCWKKGDVGDVLPGFADVIIAAGIAKAVDEPPQHKMIESPEKKKGHNIPGFTG